MTRVILHGSLTGSSRNRQHTGVWQPRETYSWFPGHTCGNNNDLCAGESVLEAIVGREIAVDSGRSVDVGDIGRYSGSVDDIVQSKLF